VKKKPKREKNPLDEMRMRHVTSETESNSKTVYNQEKKIAEMLGGKRVARQRSHKGQAKAPYDGITEQFVIENKQTKKDSISIKREWLKTITDASIGRLRTPLLAIKFLNMPIGYDEHWVMIPAIKFKEIMDE